MLVNCSVCLQIFSRFVDSTHAHVFQTISYKLEYLNCQVVDMDNFPVRVMNKRILVPGLFVPFVGVNELNVIDCNSLIATWRTQTVYLVCKAVDKSRRNSEWKETSQEFGMAVEVGVRGSLELCHGRSIELKTYQPQPNISARTKMNYIASAV